ncbi:MAG: beta-ketoacyl-[acyl-carrier-protein] synthase family protein [Bacteroidota bacterium]
MNQRVVITGMGVVAPGALNLEAFHTMLYHGDSGIQFIQELADLGFSCQVGGMANPKSEPYKDCFNYFELNEASEFIKLATVAGLECWLDAGLKIPIPGSEKVDWDTGAIIGTGIGGIDTAGKKVIPMTDAGKVKRIGSFAIHNLMPSGPSAHLSSILGLGNQTTANSSACCTGTEAILAGMHRIKSGLAERMLVGGSECYSPYFWAGFDSLRALNRYSNDQPQKASRPMSASARGFIPASGSGIMMVESLDAAKKRGARIYAEVLGGALNSGGQRNGGSMTFPNKDGVIRCLKQTFQNSGVHPSDIQLISGHLTGTKADPVEIQNWNKVFRDAGTELPFINAPKSIFGHTLGAAGIIESIAVILQMKNDFIHASLNCEDVHPEIESIINETTIPHKRIDHSGIQHAIKASFGFGDVNSAIIFKAWEA